MPLILMARMLIRHEEPDAPIESDFVLGSGGAPAVLVSSGGVPERPYRLGSDLTRHQCRDPWTGVARWLDRFPLDANSIQLVA